MIFAGRRYAFRKRSGDSVPRRVAVGARWLFGSQHHSVPPEVDWWGKAWLCCLYRYLFCLFWEKTVSWKIFAIIDAFTMQFSYSWNYNRLISGFNSLSSLFSSIFRIHKVNFQKQFLFKISKWLTHPKTLGMIIGKDFDMYRTLKDSVLDHVGISLHRLQSKV